MTDTLREHGYLTSQDIAEKFVALENQMAELERTLTCENMELSARVKELERQSRRMKLAKASLLRLQTGDILAIRIPRPLASDEQAQLTRGFRELLESVGRTDVQAVIIAGTNDALELDVIRQEATNGTDI